jgi:hypothetical protein
MDIDDNMMLHQFMEEEANAARRQQRGACNDYSYKKMS